MRSWRVNRVLNAFALLATALLLGVVVVIWVQSLLNADADPHGYVRIFGVFVGVLLLVPLVLLAAGARALRGRRRSGFVFQAAAGAVVGAYAWSVPSAARWFGIGLGAALVAGAVTGLVVTRGQSSAAPMR